MKAIIYYFGRYEDELVVTADTLEELREKAISEAQSRGWEQEYCFSKVEEETERDE